MTKYENYFEVTEELYCEALLRMIPVPRYFVYGFAAALLAVSSCVMFIGKDFMTGILWLILALLLAFYGFFGIKLRAKRNYRNQIPSLCDKQGKFWKRTVFGSESFTVTEPNASATFKYSEILGVNESKNLYVLMLRDKKLLFIKKGCFAEATDGEFIDFLKEKCNAR